MNCVLVGVQVSKQKIFFLNNEARDVRQNKFRLDNDGVDEQCCTAAAFALVRDQRVSKCQSRIDDVLSLDNARLQCRQYHNGFQIRF